MGHGGVDKGGVGRGGVGHNGYGRRGRAGIKLRLGRYMKDLRVWRF